MPLYPKPPKLPIMEKLPGPIRGLAEIFFPQDELPMPAAPLVAGVSPGMIPALKQSGKALVERIKREGLRQIRGGMQAMEDVPTPGGVLHLRQAKMPNAPAPPQLVEALEFAQRRYPRLMGHIKDIQATDPVKEANLPKGFQLAGASYPQNPLAAMMRARKAAKASNLEFNPQGRHPIETVGHELLHVADRLADPLDFGSKYKFSQTLPGGYPASAYEIRADLMGEKFAQDMQAAMEGLRKAKR